MKKKTNKRKKERKKQISGGEKEGDGKWLNSYGIHCCKENILNLTVVLRA